MFDEVAFEEARTLFMSAGEVTRPLAEEVTRLVGVLAASGALTPPPRGWTTDSVEEAVQEWWTEKLLQGTLHRAFDEAETRAGFLRYLETSLQHWRIDKQRRRGAPRLLERARRLLDGDTRFTCWRPAPDWTRSWWGLSGWSEPEPFAGDDLEVIRAGNELRDLRYVRTSADSADPILSTSDIARLLEHVFGRVRALLTPQHFDAFFRHRFPDAFPSSSMPLDDVVVSDSRTERPEAEIMSMATAQAIAAELSVRQLTVLYQKVHGDLTLDEIAANVGCSRGTVANELDRAKRCLQEYLEDWEPGTLEKLFEVAFKEDTNV